MRREGSLSPFSDGAEWSGKTHMATEGGQLRAKDRLSGSKIQNRENSIVLSKGEGGSA